MKLKILYLYSELMGYQIPILKHYVEKCNAEVHVFHWDYKKLSSFSAPSISNVFYYNRSKYKTKDIIFIAKKINPDIIFISGWMDIGYLNVARFLVNEGKKVVVGFDDIWYGNPKQIIGSIAIRLFRNVFFTNAWVTGPFQFEYAKKMGFKNSEIIYNCYSADIDLFNNSYEKYKEDKLRKYPHKFLFVGRLEKVKGIDILLEAWKELAPNRTDWSLIIVGEGSLKMNLKNYNNIEYLGYKDPNELVELIKDVGCFILPSRFEPWGVVIHEFASSGIPLICPDYCGASSTFVINNFNGLTFKTLTINELTKTMQKIIVKSDDELIQMSNNSHIMGQRITPEMCSSSFISLL